MYAKEINMEEKIFKIGDVSKLCNISIKTLRYYEELGLIKPSLIDKYTGYRYYNEKNVNEIYKIQILKELNFSLNDIKNFDENSLGSKRAELESSIKKLKDKIKLISYMQNKLGGLKMKPFINDEQAIGKWNYECSCISYEAYKNNDTYVDDDALVKEFYFLPNGEGYWIFEGWTKSEIYYFKGQIFKYKIADNKLFIEITNEQNEYEITMVFTKQDNKEYTKEEISTKDDVNMPFVLDEKALGSWIAVDWTSIKNKYNYTPKTSNNLFLKSLSILPNGDCFKEFSSGQIDKINWTKDYILSKTLASNYIITNISGEDYLIMDWKSGDYVFGKEIYGCYVFKKIIKI